MSRTPFSQGNQDFSDKAHEAAKVQLYPKIFGTENLEFERFSVGNNTQRDRILDGEFGVDVRATAHFEKEKIPISQTFQERWREPDAIKNQDITITVFNRKSGKSSELSKLNAQWFLYGYYDDKANKFLEVVLINIADLLFAISSEQIPKIPGYNPRSEQDFYGFAFSDLFQAGLIRWHLPFFPGLPSYAYATNKKIALDVSTAEFMKDDIEHLKVYIYETNRVVKDIARAMESIKNLILQLSKKMPLVRQKQKQPANGNSNKLPLFEDKED